MIFEPQLDTRADLFSCKSVYLYACSVSWVKAITHKHNQGITGSTQDPHCFRVCHTQQTVVAHLKNTHAHP